MKIDLKEFEKKYIVWTDYGYEGWRPTGYDSIEDAVRHESYGSETIITTKVNILISELVDKESKEYELS